MPTSRGILAAAAVAAAAWSGCGSDSRPQLRVPGCDARPARLDPVAPAGATTASVPGQPFDVVLDPTGRWAFASLPSTAGRAKLAVLRRDGRRLRVARVVRLDPDLQPFGLHVTRDGRLLVAAGAALISIDAANLARGRVPAPRRLATGSELIGVTATKDGRVVLATDESRAELVAVRNGGPVSRVALAPAPVGLALSGDERHVFVTSELDEGYHDAGVLSIVDARRAVGGGAGAVRAVVPAGCHPVRVVRDAARDVLWVSARESDAVVAFDASALVARPDEALLATVPVGPAPVDLALAPGGGSLVVANSDRFGASTGSLAVVDVRAALAQRGGTVGALRVGRFPRALAFARDGQLLVANFASRSIQAIPPAALGGASASDYPGSSRPARPSHESTAGPAERTRSPRTASPGPKRAPGHDAA